MGTSFVEVNDQGFWMRDSILELWLRLVALQFDEPAKDDTVIRALRDEWLLASSGHFNGCVPLDLDADLATDEGKKIIIESIEKLLVLLRKSPEKLNKDVLNLIGIESGHFSQDIDSWRLIEVSEAFLDLIDGRFTGTAAVTDFMPGCRDKPNTGR